MTTSLKCRANNPSACVDPLCPEKRGIKNSLNNAVAANDFDAFIKAKEAEAKPRPSAKFNAKSVKTLAQFTEAIKADFPDVKLYMSGSKDNYIVLDTIIIPKESRKSGQGTQIMNRLIDVADAQGWPLALTPSDSFGSSKVKLEVFYRRFGFIKNAGRSKDYAIMQSMIRPVN